MEMVANCFAAAFPSLLQQEGRQKSNVVRVPAVRENLDLEKSVMQSGEGENSGGAVVEYAETEE
jgi:hypothetical protein